MSTRGICILRHTGHSCRSSSHLGSTIGWRNGSSSGGGTRNIRQTRNTKQMYEKQIAKGKRVKEVVSVRKFGGEDAAFVFLLKEWVRDADTTRKVQVIAQGCDICFRRADISDMGKVPILKPRLLERPREHLTNGKNLSKVEARLQPFPSSEIPAYGKLSHHRTITRTLTILHRCNRAALGPSEQHMRVDTRGRELNTAPARNVRKFTGLTRVYAGKFDVPRPGWGPRPGWSPLNRLWDDFAVLFLCDSGRLLHQPYTHSIM